MPDITEQLQRESTPDPHYNPLPPSIEDFSEYNYHPDETDEHHIAQLSSYRDALDYWGNQITIEWATREMQGHLMGWVRVGLVADRVRRYRLYRPHFPNWLAYCRAVLQKDNWQVNKMIDCAQAVMALIEEGFNRVPNCISQAEKLITCCKKTGQLLVDAWQTVTEEFPQGCRITANKISEALGFAVDHGDKIPKGIRDRLKAIADRDGMSFEEKLEELIYLDELTTKDKEGLDETESEPEVSEEVKEQEWREDMNQLVKEHDHQLWFLSAVTRLFPQVTSSSQFNWLRQLRYQA